MTRALLVLASLVALALGSTVMVVDSDEVAVVLRFGAVHRSTASGLAFRLPWPIESDERVRVTEVRSAELGRRVLLTGDTNLVEVDIVAQYSVSDPVAFVTTVGGPDDLVAAVIGARLTTEVLGMEVDALLTTGRTTLEQEVLRAAQESLSALSVGVRLEAVELRALEPPDAVVAAFNDVSSARGDRATMILSAETYASQRLPEVRGLNAQLHEVAGTHAAERRSQARADVARFEALLPAWRLAPVAVRRQLQQEVAAQSSPVVRFITPGTRVILP